MLPSSPQALPPPLTFLLTGLLGPEVLHLERPMLEVAFLSLPETLSQDLGRQPTWPEVPPP